MATQDGQPDGLEFRDRTETLLERTADKYNQVTFRHPPSLLDHRGISVQNQISDKPDGVVPFTGDILPTIKEEHEAADDPDANTDGSPEPVTVHVADSPEPAPNQHAFDQTHHEGPVLAAEDTHLSYNPLHHSAQRTR